MKRKAPISLGCPGSQLTLKSPGPYNHTTVFDHVLLNTSGSDQLVSPRLKSLPESAGCTFRHQGTRLLLLVLQPLPGSCSGPPSISGSSFDHGTVSFQVGQKRRHLSVQAVSRLRFLDHDVLVLLRSNSDAMRRLV